MSLMLLQAVTSVRVGDGSSVSAMNLPVSRERHTRWPFLPGSTLKGALRARAIVHGLQPIEEVFGGAPGEVDDEESATSMGSLRVGPATLLALPVRSLTSTFALLTCPTALARFGRMLTDPPPLPAVPIEAALVADGGRLDHVGPVQVGGAAQGLVLLEDLDLEGAASAEVQAWVDAIRRIAGDEVPAATLTVVHDDVFAHACLAWTEHRTRNRIGADGVVEDKLLFVVESLPAETLFWTVVEGEGGEWSSNERAVLPREGELFTLGGHQSVGMGRVTWFGGGE